MGETSLTNPEIIKGKEGFSIAREKSSKKKYFKMRTGGGSKKPLAKRRGSREKGREQNPNLPPANW